MTDRMTNDEIQMTNEFRMTNVKPVVNPIRAYSSFGLRHSFIKHQFAILLGPLLLAGQVKFLADQPASPPAETSRAVTYRNDRRPDGPFSIHIVKVDRSRADYEFVTAHARGTVLGLGTVSAQVRLVPPEAGRPIAAINGHFFQRDSDFYNGDPMGLQILNGDLVSGPNHSECFWIDAQWNPHITNVESPFKITWPNGEMAPFGLNEP